SIFGARDSHDVTGLDRLRLELFAAIGLNVPELTDELFLAEPRIERSRSTFEDARVDADETQIAVRIGLDLQHQTSERLFARRLPCFLAVDTFGHRVVPFDRRAIDGAGEILSDRVKQRLDSDVVQR